MSGKQRRFGNVILIIIKNLVIFCFEFLHESWFENLYQRLKERVLFQIIYRQLSVG